MNQILMEILRQKRTALIIILALILLNIVCSVLISSRQEPGLAAARTKWGEVRDRSARAGRADAATLYRQGAADLERLMAAIPAKREFARVLSDLIGSAGDSGVIMGNISYRPVPVKDEGLLSYQLTLSVGGGYAAVKSYLADLQENPELIVVDGITLTNSDLFEENVVMQLNLTIYLQEGA